MVAGATVICKSWTYCYLTFDREYRVEKTNGKFVWVKNDYGKVTKFKSDKFVLKT